MVIGVKFFKWSLHVALFFSSSARGEGACQEVATPSPTPTASGGADLHWHLVLGAVDRPIYKTLTVIGLPGRSIHRHLNDRRATLRPDKSRSPPPWGCVSPLFGCVSRCSSSWQSLLHQNWMESEQSIKRLSREESCMSLFLLPFFFLSSFFKRTAQDKRGSRGSASARGPGNQVCIVKGLVLLTVRRGRFLLSFSHFHIRCCFSLLSSLHPPFHPPDAWFDWTAALAPPTATWPTKRSVWFDWNFRWNVRFHWRTWMFSLWRMKE